MGPVEWFGRQGSPCGSAREDDEKVPGDLARREAEDMIPDGSLAGDGIPVVGDAWFREDGVVLGRCREIVLRKNWKPDDISLQVGCWNGTEDLGQ